MEDVHQNGRRSIYDESRGAIGPRALICRDMITGIILAAGRSRRMGDPNALLALGDQTFLSHTIGVLRAGGCDEDIVVTGSAEEPR